MVPIYQQLLRVEPGTFWMTNPDDPGARDRIGTVRSPLVLTTIDSAKGLEFPRVVLLGLERSGREQEDLRKLIYVGMTRAMERLTVLFPSH